MPDPTGQDAAFDAGDAAAGTDVSSWDVDTLIRLRILMQQTNALAEATSELLPTVIIEYNHNSGGWTAVAAIAAVTDAVRFADGQPVDGADTVVQLIGSGTFIDGEYLEVTGGHSITFGELAVEESEVETAIELYSGQVADEDTIDLRVGFASAPTNTPTYTDVGRLIVNEAAPGFPNELLMHRRQNTLLRM